jgi:hypothetical protein
VEHLGKGGFALGSPFPKTAWKDLIHWWCLLAGYTLESSQTNQRTFTRFLLGERSDNSSSFHFRKQTNPTSSHFWYTSVVFIFTRRSYFLFARVHAKCHTLSSHT